MSYGNWSIWADIRRGLSNEYIARKICMRYDDIDYERAKEIVKDVRDGGPNAIVDWSKRSAEGVK